jgi:hypothetical protein
MLLAMAYCERMSQRPGSASLLLRHLSQLLMPDLYSALHLAELVPRIAKFESEVDGLFGIVPIELQLERDFPVERAQILIDGRPLIKGKGTSPTALVLTPLPTDLPFRIGQTEVQLVPPPDKQPAPDKLRRPPSRAPRTVPGAAAKAVPVDDSETQLEQTEQVFLASLAVPVLTSASFKLLLDPGTHTVVLRDTQGKFADYTVPDGLHVREGLHGVVTIDQRHRDALIDLKIPAELKAESENEKKEDGARSAKSSAAPAPRLVRSLSVEIQDPKGVKVRPPIVQPSDIGLISISVPPNRSPEERYTLIATLSDGDFLPFRTPLAKTLGPGQRQEVTAQFSVRPLYKKWTFWTWLGLGLMTAAAAVGGGVQGYNRATTYDGGTVNWVIR